MSWTPDPPTGAPPPGWQQGAPPPGYGYGGYPPTQEHPQGTTVLVLGILGLVVCQILGPFAWTMGNKALKEIDASGVTFTNRSSIQAGRICGIIATVLLVVTVLFFFFAFVVVAFLGTKASSNFDTVGSSIVGFLAPIGA